LTVSRWGGIIIGAMGLSSTAVSFPPSKEQEQASVSQERIAVAFVCNHKFIRGLLVVLWGICVSCSKGKSLVFHILDTGLTAKDRKRVERLKEHFPHLDLRVTFHTIDMARYAHVPTWRGSRIAFVRCYLPEILPEEDFVIYSDSDVFWRRDIAELWEQRKPQTMLWAVPDGSGLMDYSSGEKRNADFAKLGKSVVPEHYFCGGLLMMNLRALREEGFIRRMEDFLSKHADKLRFPDQDLFNLFYPHPQTVLLDWRWGEFSVAYGKRECASPRVIHYANDAPWTRAPSLAGMFWWEDLRDACSAVGWFSQGLFARLQVYRHQFLRTPVGFFLCRWFFLLINRKLFKKRWYALHPEAIKKWQ